MTITQDTQPPVESYPRTSVRTNGEASYDERFRWGSILILIGGAIWLLAVLIYSVKANDTVDVTNPFNDTANEVAGFLWGGVIFGFGCFVMLCGVILIAGAQRTKS